VARDTAFALRAQYAALRPAADVQKETVPLLTSLRRCGSRSGMSPSSDTRLSNGFNCTIENHMAVVALNYSRTTSSRFTRRSGRCRDAAGVTTRLFDVSDLAALLIESESQNAPERP